MERSKKSKETKDKKLEWRYSLVPSLLSINQILALAVKEHAKVDVKLVLHQTCSYPIQFYWTSLFRSKHFVRDCSLKSR